MKCCYFTATILIGILFVVSCKNEITDPVKMTGTISGIVKDAVTNNPIQGISIKSRPATSNCVTDNEGKFTLNEVTSGNYVITAFHADYKNDSVTVNITPNKTAYANFSLRHTDPPPYITQPILLTPSNGETNTPLTVDLTWTTAKSNVSNSIIYNIYLDTSPNPTTNIHSIYNDTTARVTVTSKNTCYYWKVRAFNSNLNMSYSEVHSFTTNNTPNQQINITYKTPPPVGKRPYPIHDPSFTQVQYDNMVNKVFLINNFGQDQFSYLHDGLDFVARNGTKIFAIDSGYVKSITLSTDPSYNTMIIADKDNPNTGWSYTHIGNFNVRVGDFVKQGTYVAEISFVGVEHIHLSRIYCLPGNNLSLYPEQIMIQPDKYFYLPDTKAPMIKTPFYYFPNNSDNRFTNTYIITNVTGKVDIVVGIRETGEYARGRDSYMFDYGDRIAMNKIVYKITGPDNVASFFNSFNFSNIHIPSKDNRTTEPLIYKSYQLIEGGERTNFSDSFSYYIITNNEGKENNEPLRISDAALSWDTKDKLDNGLPKYPNGVYRITVTAYDYAGHSTFAGDQVNVNN